MRLMSSLAGLTGLADVQYGEADGVRREVVALGFVKMSIETVVNRSVIGEGAERMSGLDEVLRSARWFELENSALGDRVQDVSGEFDVSVDELQRTLDCALGMGMGRWTRVLWHSHYRSEMPSGYDLEHFPEWLCDVGVVYYAPLMSNVLYSSGGVLSGLRTQGAQRDLPSTPNVQSPLKAHESTRVTV